MGTSGKMFKLGWFKFLDILEAEGGPPHIPFDGIWLNVQTRVRTPNKI